MFLYKRGKKGGVDAVSATDCKHRAAVLVRWVGLIAVQRS